MTPQMYKKCLYQPSMQLKNSASFGIDDAVTDDSGQCVTGVVELL